MSPRKALITGITGQDGSYLTELLVGKGYEVYGLQRQGAGGVRAELREILAPVHMLAGDLKDYDSLVLALRKSRPDEIYNLAAQSNPGESWRSPLETAEVNALGAQKLFDAAWLEAPSSRLFHASSSEIFGDMSASVLDEHSPLEPLNPYAASKIFAHQVAGLMRRRRRQFIACGILFNHESPRRGMPYVTQKIAYGAACISLGIVDSEQLNEAGEPIVRGAKVALGNLDVVRDWGYAGDYVEAMWLTLQHGEPGDFEIGTGVGHSIRDLCRQAFECVGLDWQQHIVIDRRLIRESERPAATADPEKARALLGWTARMRFEELIATMVQSHRQRLMALSGRRS
jgi:GDPmannose 4,6-dehydratase